jgi:hypothetical protein
MESRGNIAMRAMRNCFMVELRIIHRFLRIKKSDTKKGVEAGG